MFLSGKLHSLGFHMMSAWELHFCLANVNSNSAQICKGQADTYTRVQNHQEEAHKYTSTSSPTAFFLLLNSYGRLNTLLPCFLFFGFFLLGFLVNCSTQWSKQHYSSFTDEEAGSQSFTPILGGPCNTDRFSEDKHHHHNTNASWWRCGCLRGKKQWNQSDALHPKRSPHPVG